MAMKRVPQQFKPVLKELKTLFKKERCLIPQSQPECELEGKILLGCELLRSYMTEDKKQRDVEVRIPRLCNLSVDSLRKEIAYFTATFQNSSLSET